VAHLPPGTSTAPKSHHYRGLIPQVDLRQLLEAVGIDPDDTLVMRHTPDQPALRQRLPWLAAERPTVFAAYQSMHRERVEASLRARGHLASFIADRDAPDRALFVGMYAVRGARPISEEEFYAIPENQELRELGSRGPDTDRQHLWFELEELPHMQEWKGRLVVGWTRGMAYARLPRPGKFPLVALHDESRLHAERPDPRTLMLEHWQLGSLPPSWQQTLREWRGIYLIFDRSSRQGYVGAAYGDDNLLHRWLEYHRTGDGGNRRLLGRDPQQFAYSVLQLTARDTPIAEVQELERSWKLRLHTREHGLNDN